MTLTKVSYSMINGAPINVLDYGAYNDGTNATATTAAIRNAIDFAQLTQSTIYFPSGKYSINDTIQLSDVPIGFLGEQNPVWQSGSDFPSVTLQWTGGAAPMFECTYSNFQFEGMAISNLTNATDFMYIHNGQRYRFYRVNWLNATGTNPFSRSIIYCDDPSFGYSTVASCQFGGAAPIFLYVAGTGSSNGLTPFVFDDRCIFESAAGAPLTVIYFKDVNCDALTIENCTFNQQGGAELCILDTSDTPRATTTIACLNFNNNEWDYSATGLATDRMMRLVNVNNIVMNGNNLQCGGNVDATVELVNSNVSQFSGNFIRATASFFDADSDSFVNIGHNWTEYQSMGYLVSGGATGCITIPWSANTYFGLQRGDASRNTVYVISVTAGTSWEIAFRTGSSTGAGYCIPGQVFTIQIKNTSGGVISAPTWAGGNIKTAGAFTVPANGYNRSITFVYNGTYFYELYRTSADVAN